MFSYLLNDFPDEGSSIILAFAVSFSHFVIILLYYTRRARRGENHIFKLSHFSSYLIEINGVFTE